MAIKHALHIDEKNVLNKLLRNGINRLIKSFTRLISSLPGLRTGTSSPRLYSTGQDDLVMSFILTNLILNLNLIRNLVC